MPRKKGTIDVRVLMTSTSYPRSSDDWRGRFIADMVFALAARSDLKLSCWMPPGESLGLAMDATNQVDRQWLDRLAEAGGIIHLLRTSPVRGLLSAGSLLRRLRGAYRQTDWDVAHVNWLQNALPLPSGKAAVITVLGSDFGLLRLPGMVQMVRAMLRGRRALLAPNGDWMAPELERRFGDLAAVRTIPFGVNDTWFAVERRQGDGPAPWLVVSRITKGKLGNLLEWGEGLFGPDQPLVLLGPMQEEIALPSWVDYRGATHPEALAREWFPRAAGLLTLSTHDEGRPQVILDAMAAGLPVIASGIPAHRDLLQHDNTGWLAGSAAELKDGLEMLSRPMERLRLGKAARAWVKQEIGDWSVCAGRYMEAYRQVLDGGDRP